MLASSQNCEKRLSVSLCPSICLPSPPRAGMERFGSQWTDFYEMVRIEHFSKICREDSSFIKIWQEWRQGTLCAEQCTVMTTSRSVFLRMRNVSEISCRGNQDTHHFSFNNFLPKNRAVCEIMWKNMVGLQRPQMAIYHGACALHAAYLRLQTHTICNTHCLSAASLVARTRLIVPFYAQCQSCS